jgi:imidazolonepropionase-like amidohydrolase
MLMLLAVGIAQAQSTYIVAGSLIDPLNEEVISDPVVEIQDNRIVAVTRGGNVPDNAEVIDLRGFTLLPGLADLHTHLTWNPSDLGYGGLAVSITDQAVRGVVSIATSRVPLSSVMRITLPVMT